jgi:RecJ-like exonuclease
MRYGTILLLSLISGLFVYGFFFHTCGSNEPAVKSDLSITAMDLAAAFDRNEALSDSLYFNKVLSVTGVVRQLRKTGPGGYAFTLGDGLPGKTAVDCRLDSPYYRLYPTLKTGDSLRLLGTCAGRLHDVILVQCIIEK